MSANLTHHRTLCQSSKDGPSKSITMTLKPPHFVTVLGFTCRINPSAHTCILDGVLVSPLSTQDILHHLHAAKCIPLTRMISLFSAACQDPVSTRDGIAHSQQNPAGRQLGEANETRASHLRGGSLGLRALPARKIYAGKALAPLQMLQKLGFVEKHGMTA